MPFYRITILLQDDRVVQGIREHSNSNIDYVTNLYRAKASAEYGKELVDIEAAMLSKNSTAVKHYLDEKLKRMQKKKEWGTNTINPFSNYDRKKGNNNKPALGERSNRKDCIHPNFYKAAC